MSLLTIPNVFSFQEDPIPSDGINVNFTTVAGIVNNLDEDNVNPASEIAIKHVVSDITAVWTFVSNPVFAAGAILDAYLTSNVPLKNAANVFTGINTFDQAISKFKPPILGTHPTTAAEDNYEYIYSGDNKRYRYIHLTGPVQMDYVGGYTGGALRPYSGQFVIDENTPGEIMFKCDSGFTSVKLALIGTEFPSYIYTELPQHSHGSGTLALTDGVVANTDHDHDTDIGHGHPGTTFASATHKHTMNKHTHGIGTYAITDVVDHNHTGFTGYISYTYTNPPQHRHSISNDGAQVMSISGVSENKDPGDTNNNATAASVSSYVGSPTSGLPTYGTPASVSTVISGDTAVAGILGNTLNDTKKLNITTAIKLYISNDRAAYGSGYDSGDYAALLNILAANGTGEIDITSRCVIGINYIKVIDETVKKGGTVLYHLEIV